MIKFFAEIGEFKKVAKNQDMDVNVGALLRLDFPFFENSEKFTAISIPDYSSENPKNIIVASKDYTLIYSRKDLDGLDKNFKQIIKKAYGESTIVIFIMLKNVLRNYSKEFEKIRIIMNKLDLRPVLEEIEKSGRDLRRLTDRIEELVRLTIMLEEREVKEFDTSLIKFDYDILRGEMRYWLERCRSHIYRVASLRTKSEMASSKELNARITRLTVIMTFLTIVSIVVNVPGTIGAIFGIPALSNAYFESHIQFLIITLISATILSIIFGYIYWKSLKLTQD
jgi:Mg2+ and Co2+ transporter CorA